MSLRTQIWLMLSAVVLLAFVVAALLLAQQTLSGGSRQVAEWIDFAARQADGARAEDYRQHQDGRTPLLMSRRDPPPDEPSVLPLAVAVVADLRDWRGADAVRIEGGTRPTIWIQSDRDPALWHGVPLQTLRGNIARASWWILLSSAALILLVGAWFSGRITRSLSELADAAPNLVHGQLNVAKSAGGAREVRVLAEALEAAAASVHRHYHARESWLTGFSHDLRTPIARLKFALELEPAPGPGGDALPDVRAHRLAAAGWGLVHSRSPSVPGTGADEPVEECLRSRGATDHCASGIHDGRGSNRGPEFKSETVDRSHRIRHGSGRGADHGQPAWRALCDGRGRRRSRSESRLAGLSAQCHL
ncbi:MAG: HAMP domain-containing histidine kinase [Ahniella sp.]|nr:HAMP domain-containing histidine kinase [Ahniella sp.]